MGIRVNTVGLNDGKQFRISNFSATISFSGRNQKKLFAEMLASTIIEFARRAGHSDKNKPTVLKTELTIDKKRSNVFYSMIDHNKNQLFMVLNPDLNEPVIPESRAYRNGALILLSKENVRSRKFSNLVREVIEQLLEGNLKRPNVNY